MPTAGKPQGTRPFSALMKPPGVSQWFYRAQ